MFHSLAQTYLLGQDMAVAERSFDSASPYN